MFVKSIVDGIVERHRINQLNKLIRPGNLIILDAKEYTVPPRKGSYSLCGYRIELGGWSKDVVIVPIDPRVDSRVKSVSGVAAVLRYMGYEVTPIVIAYEGNRGDCPQCMPYTTVTR
jgi:hypothetical protein